MKQWVLDRLREPSTWRGMVWLAAGVAGMQVDDAQVEQVIAAGAVLAGLIGITARGA
jgi:hypothetical protein